MSHGLQLPPGLSFDRWVAVGQRLAGVASASAWWLGDWLLYGERAYGRRYKEALNTTQLDYQTLRNYAWVARRFELSRRRDKLSFQHHAELAALTEAEQDLWLSRAERAHWSRSELRRQLHRAKQHPDANSHAPAHDVVVRVEVAGVREERWRQAATLAEQDFIAWIASAVDAAADAELRDDEEDVADPDRDDFPDSHGDDPPCAA